MTTPSRMFCSRDEVYQHLQSGEVTTRDLVLFKSPISGALALVILVLEVKDNGYLLDFVRIGETQLFEILKASAKQNHVAWKKALDSGNFPVELLGDEAPGLLISEVIPLTAEQKTELVSICV